MRRLSVLGAGKVGRVLAQKFSQAQIFEMGQICNRSLASAEQALRFIGAGRAAAQMADLQRADVWMLSVADDQIAPACAALAAQGLLQGDSIVFHCSGAKASTELQAALACGAAVASVHPVRSFADPSQLAADFSGTICSIEGDARALAVLIPALQACQAQVVSIATEGKLLYHAGSVFACNYLTSLMETALRAYAAAGIPPGLARALAEPLARQTLDNIFQTSPAQALTGPIARGDMETVARQQAALDAWDGQAGALYRAFVPLTQRLAGKS